jgi:hypothetical protein
MTYWWNSPQKLLPTPQVAALLILSSCYYLALPAVMPHLQRLAAAVKLVLHLISSTQLVKAGAKWSGDHLHAKTQTTQIHVLTVNVHHLRFIMWWAQSYLISACTKPAPGAVARIEDRTSPHSHTATQPGISAEPSRGYDIEQHRAVTFHNDVMLVTSCLTNEHCAALMFRLRAGNTRSN